jgi:hypothetical protein
LALAIVAGQLLPLEVDGFHVTVFQGQMFADPLLGSFWHSIRAMFFHVPWTLPHWATATATSSATLPGTHHRNLI